MYTIEQYIKDTKSLTNSLVIKINEIPMVLNQAVAMEAEDRQEPHMVPDMAKKREWKYYLNLAGKMHKYDKPVYIKVLETDKEEILTSDLLRKYPTTHTELKENTGLYEQLMSNYPEHLRYIHGCMYPVDADKAINAKEGTILAYNENYIETNEYYLIQELEDYIKRILHRWHVKPYSIVDELYLPSLMAFLYMAVYLKIFNIRLSKIHSYQVHSFHLEHYFRSHMDLWDDIKVLNKQSIFWLYKNLDVMLHNVGKAKTFEKIYNKLFHMNGIGLGEYKASRKDPKFTNEMYNLQRPSFDMEPVTLVTTNLNDFYLTNKGNVTSVESMIRNELELLPDVNKNIPSNFKRYFIDIGVLESEKTVRETEKTKILDIDTIKTLKKTGLDIFALIMDYWVYALKKDKLYKESITYPGNVYKVNKRVHSFTDEEIEIKTSDNRLYKVTPKVGLLMFIKLMLHASGELDRKISKVKYFRILDSDPVKFQEAIDTKTIKDGLSYALLRSIKDNLVPEPSLFPTIKSFQKFLGDNIELSKAIWVFMSNSQNFLTTDNVKRVFMLLARDGEYDLTTDGVPKTIDQLLADHGVNYTIDGNIDMVKTMSLLIETFTGIKVDKEDELISNMNKYRTILKKLTSYSLQAIGAEGIDKEIVAYYHNPTMLKTERGLVMSYGIHVRGLEEPFGRLITDSNDNPKGINLNKIIYRPMLSLDGPIKGHMILKYHELRRDGYPSEFHADFITLPSYNFDHHKWFVEWITTKAMEVEGLEKKIADLSGDDIDIPSPELAMNRVTDKGVLNTLNKIKGDMIVYEGPWLARTGYYSFTNMPYCWYKPLLENLLTISGVEVKGLADPFELDTDSKDEDNPTPEFYRIADTGMIGIGSKVEGSMFIKDTFTKDDMSLSIGKNNEILKMEAFPKDKEYVSIGLLAFRLYDNQGHVVSDKTSGLVTYVSKQVYEKNNALHIFNTAFRNNKLKEDVKEITINKTDTIGLAMLPFQLELDKDNTLGSKSKIEFIGLIDKNGTLDIYDCRNITSIDQVYIQHQPTIRINNFSVFEILPTDTTERLVLSDMDMEAIVNEYKQPKEPKGRLNEEEIRAYKEKLEKMAPSIDPELLDVIGQYDVEKYPFLKNLKLKPNP